MAKRPTAAQAKVPRRFITGTARLSQYDRLNVESPVLIRTTERKPGTGQALVKPVRKPKRDRKPRDERKQLDSRAFAAVATINQILKPQLESLPRGSVKRGRILAEIKRLQAVYQGLCNDAGISPERAAEAIKDHAPGIPAWER